jgi:hypothetical protein
MGELYIATQRYAVDVEDPAWLKGAAFVSSLLQSSR